jgi:Cu/Ag efflux pump CusA
VQDVVGTALGGQAITTTVEGRERYTVNMRYPRDLRSDPQSIARDVLVPRPAGGAVPLGEVASVALTRGPSSIRTENGQLAFISMSTSGIAISAAMSPMLRPPWSTRTGSEVMQRIAVSMIGGMISSTILTLIVIPAIYGLINGWNLPLRMQESESAALADSRIAAE